jgi:hypothetical protein
MILVGGVIIATAWPKKDNSNFLTFTRVLGCTCFMTQVKFQNRASILFQQFLSCQTPKNDPDCLVNLERAHGGLKDFETSQLPVLEFFPGLTWIMKQVCPWVQDDRNIFMPNSGV